MKLIHLSDLHIGKRVNEFSMLEDQEYILIKILNIIDDEKPDCVIIAGDVYDKSIPSSEAVTLFDDFLYKLSGRDLKTFVLSGNHDSPERIAFGARLMDRSGVHMSPVYEGKIEPVRLEDEYGPFTILMLPFIKPIHVRRFFPDEEIVSYNDALKIAIDNIKIEKSERNILVSHQFVTGAIRSESEDISVGGLDNVECTLFDGFDYVALGHIHRPQQISRETLRYCGTPLKYSFSEAKDNKSVTVVELKEKGNIKIKTVPLIPKRDLREIKGTYNELTLKSNYENTNINDYTRITLTDENDIPDAISKLRVIYPNLMKLDYDNARTKSDNQITGIENAKTKTPGELFSELYKLQNNRTMLTEQEVFLNSLIEKIWEDEK